MDKNSLIIISIISVVLAISIFSINGFVIYKTRAPQVQRPLILVHGHSQPAPAMTWNQYKSKLASDGYYVDQGFMTIYTYAYARRQGSWPANSVVTMTYYNPSPTESINTYAQRLSNIVEKVRYNTGSDKVDIVAHSMGGLVSRAYIEKYGGTAKVNKLIMVGTPNHGITDLIALGCPNTEPECQEMLSGSKFLNSLSFNGRSIYITIAGDELGRGTDGIVQVSSVHLSNAEKNVVLNGYSHLDLIGSPKYPNDAEYRFILSSLVGPMKVFTSK